MNTEQIIQLLQPYAKIKAIAKAIEELKHQPKQAKKRVNPAHLSMLQEFFELQAECGLNLPDAAELAGLQYGTLSSIKRAVDNNSFTHLQSRVANKIKEGVKLLQSE